jgi:phenylacetate-CoA ligase
VSRNGRPTDELASFPSLPPDRQRQALSQRLLKQIHYFGQREDALAEWREAARIQDPSELWKIWPSLPILRKSDLNSRFNPYELKARFNLEGLTKSTGGSTGEPTHFLHDEQMVRASNAASYYAQVRMGWRPGMALMKIWGSERDIGKETSLYNRVSGCILRQYLVDGYSLTQHTVDRVLKIMLERRPVCFYGFTSMLDFVARSLLERNCTPPPGTVHAAWNGGEMLFDTQVERFRQAFGVPILNFYGGRELAAMACQFEDGGPLWALRPWLFLEVVNERGKPVSPGEPGRLLWTSTVCHGTPFLRYEIEDVGVFDAAHHTEAGIVALRELHGRTAGLLELPDGKTINCLYWNHLFKDVPEVQQFQVVLQRDGGLKLILRGAGFTPAREAELRGTVGKFLGALPLRISWVNIIPLSPQGKLVQVVRE